MHFVLNSIAGYVLQSSIFFWDFRFEEFLIELVEIRVRSLVFLSVSFGGLKVTFGWI